MVIGFSVHETTVLTQTGAKNKQKSSRELRPCEWERLADEKGQRRTVRLVRADREAIIAQITALCQKSVSQRIYPDELQQQESTSGSSPVSQEQQTMCKTSPGIFPIIYCPVSVPSVVSDFLVQMFDEIN